MALFNDSVSREQYEDMRAQRAAWQQRYDTLLDKYHSLRAFQSPVNPMKAIPPRPDSATETLDAMEQSTRDPRIEAAVKTLLAEKPELNPAAALREAKRMLDIATGKADAPVLTTIGAALR